MSTVHAGHSQINRITQHPLRPNRDAFALQIAHQPANGMDCVYAKRVCALFLEAVRPFIGVGQYCFPHLFCLFNYVRAPRVPVIWFAFIPWQKIYYLFVCVPKNPHMNYWSIKFQRMLTISMVRTTTIPRTTYMRIAKYLLHIYVKWFMVLAKPGKKQQQQQCGVVTHPAPIV